MCVFPGLVPFAVLSESVPPGLTLGGLIFVGLAWSTVIALVVFCYRKVLMKSAQRRREVRERMLSEAGHE